MSKLVMKLIGTSLNVGAFIVPKKTALKGFELFCTPFRLTLKPEQIDFLATATQERFVCENVAEIQVYKWGNGSKKILFLHGWQSHSFRWVKYIQALLKEDFTIYSLDGPAHGNSSGKLMNLPMYSEVFFDFRKKYGDMDYYVGHSLGAFNLMYSFYKDPTLKASGLVLLAAPGNAQDFVEFYSDALGLNKKAMSLVSNRFVDLFGVPPSYFSSERFSEKLNSPGLIIHDRGDVEAPFHYAEKMHANWSQSEVYFTDGLGHKLRSPEIVDLVIDFVKR